MATLLVIASAASIGWVRTGGEAAAAETPEGRLRQEGRACLHAAAQHCPMLGAESWRDFSALVHVVGQMNSH
jgi:hypothetical protein